MSPAWIAPALLAAGIAALAFAAPRASAAEPDRRQWRIEVCIEDRCELRGVALSGPTACNLDLVSLANTMPKGSRLSCVKEQKR
jgi:hypothetical protein